MTVIAWDGKTLAADRLVVVENIRVGLAAKIRRCDGNLIGTTGVSAIADMMVDWFLAGRNPATYPPEASGAERYGEIIVVTPAREVLIFNNWPTPSTFSADEQVAIGCAWDTAMVAMKCGLSARDAVLKVSEMDIRLGGGVDVLTFE